MDTKKIPLLALTAIAVSVSSIVVHATDSDGDGISDSADNCPFIYNPGQEDSDMQPVPSGCGDGYCDWPEEPDWCPEDCGGICLPYIPFCGNGQCESSCCWWPETFLNCPQDCPPPGESDGYGDVCDNCPDGFNPDQLDFDGDSVGDDCDNCPETYNPSQADSDGDYVGNACDDDCPNLDQLNPVGLVDFSIFGAYWQVAGVNLPGDLNFDDVVDINDLGVFSAYWLSDCYE